MSKITLVHGDDWEGMYVDGRLMDQGHRVSITSALRIMGHDVENVSANLDWLEARGDLPDQLTRVKKAK